MNKSHIEIHEGLSIDLSQLKCFRINTGYGEPWVIVEYKMRHEYVYNPESDAYELQVCNDQTKIEFTSYEGSVMFVEEWNKIWQKYLDGQL